MPQMAPLLWLNLFFMFIISLILFLSFNYFIKPFNKMDFSDSYLYKPEKHWKW
uniref:ATP synthase complex subunit 8 n=1 Tax=Umalia orientalis TaxID=1603554 RepID=A0A0D3QFS6_9EUCA|nr:ATP synthase F0 subunit 8 [Umalia orientalis]AJF14611.1 ATPase8 [Umalia orientalis]